MAETPGRRRPPQKYPEELRERAVRMVLESIEAAGGERFGVVTRVAKQLGIGTESLRQWCQPGGGRYGAAAGQHT